MFCGGKPVTPEHYLGKAFLRRVFAQGRKARYDFYRSNYIADKFATEQQVFVATEPDVTATCACDPCNSGWMNRARERIEPLIEPMILGKRTKVTRLRDISALASWASQISLCAANDMTEIASTLGPAFYRERLPLPHFRVRLGQAVTPESELQVMVNVTQLHTAPRHVPSRVEAYSFTVRVGHLILQVLCPPPGHEAEITSKPLWDDLTIPVWPPTLAPIDWPWPPRRPLDSIDFHHLAQAYYEPAPPTRPVTHRRLPPAKG